MKLTLNDKQIISCTRCILDSMDDPEIVLDTNGICNHCLSYDDNYNKYYRGNEMDLQTFHNWISRVKAEGKNSKYDVLIGLSGGVDSTYVAYLCWKHGVRALVVHLDNGWNSELSVVNMKNTLKITGFDLVTYVINWKEFRDLQRAYFKSHVVDIEALTDHAIGSVLERIAEKNNIKYIFNGSSITTEGRLPASWVHNKSDSINIRSIHKKFGELPLKTFPIKNVWKKMICKSKVNSIPILDYYPYNKIDAKKLIAKEFHWKDYGGKHYESIFTRFYQAYILPRKFGIDKRKSHYSTLICAEQLTKMEALEMMKSHTYSDEKIEKNDLEFVLKKLGFTQNEFNEYISTPEIKHTEYQSIENFLDIGRPFYRKIKSIIRLSSLK
jgi:N-acetyl sugar amidotransferase